MYVETKTVRTRDGVQQVRLISQGERATRRASTGISLGVDALSMHGRRQGLAPPQAA